MKIILDGISQNEAILEVFKGADRTIQAAFITDVGVPIAQTGETWSLEIYEDSKRTDAAIDTVTFTPVTAAAGLGTFVFTDGDTAAAAYVANGVYYAYGKRVDAGSLISFSSNYLKLRIR